MISKELIQPGDVLAPKTAYSQALLVTGGKTLYVAGQIAFDENGHLVGPDDFRTQTVQTFENIKRLLAAAGATFENLVKLNIYITDIKYYTLVQEVRVQYLSRPWPASTLVEVGALVHPKAMIEIEGIAVL